MTRIVFFGTSNYCIPVLQSLKGHFDLVAVITKPNPNPVIEFTRKYDIKLLTPIGTLELMNLKENIKSLSPDLSVVSDYGYIIPESIFTIPRKQTINIHFSHLPLLRGASPVQYSILFGSKDTAVSVIKMAKTVDSGDILKVMDYPDIKINIETTKSLYEKLFLKISEDLPQIIKEYLSGNIILVKQNHKLATFTRKLTRDDGFLPFNSFQLILHDQPLKKAFKRTLINDALDETDSAAKTIERAIRAFDPWPGIWTQLPNNKRLKILKIQLRPSVIARSPDLIGTTWQSHANASFIPEIVHLEGKKPVSWNQFLEGHPDIKNQLNL